MSTIIKLLTRASGSSVVPTSGKTVGLNSAGMAYYDLQFYSVNMFNNIGVNQNGSGAPALDSLYRLSNLASTKRVFYNMWLGQNGGPAKIKTGLYHVYWTGDDLAVDLSSNHVASGSLTKVAPGHWTFILNQFQDGAGVNQLSIGFTNNAGTTSGTQQHMGMVHDSFFTYWLTDAWDSSINPDYITWAGQNLAVWRNMKAAAIENSSVTNDTTAILTEQHVFWGGAQVYGGGPVNGQPSTTGMPYSFQAKICAKLNCDLVACVPLGSSDAVMDLCAQQVKSVPQFTGAVWPCAGNENWNTGYKSPLGEATTGGNAAFQYLNNDYPGLWPTASFSNFRQAEAHAHCRAWAAFKRAGFSESRLRIYVEQQYVDPTGGGGVVLDSINWVDTTNVLGKGSVALKTVLQGYAVAPYNSPVDPDGNALFNARFTEFDWLNMDDATVGGFFSRGQDATAALVPGIVNTVKSLAPNAQLVCYEWGQQCIGGISGFGGGNIPFNVDHTANTMKSISGNAQFRITKDGDGWFWYYNGVDGANGCPITTYNPGAYPQTPIYTRRRLGNSEELYCYDTYAKAIAVYADDAAAKAASLVLNAVATAPFLGANFTRMQEACLRIRTWMDTNPGKQMYRNFFNATIGANKFNYTCQLSDLGEYAVPDNYAVKLFGLKATLYADDTPRSLWHNAQVGTPALP